MIGEIRQLISRIYQEEAEKRHAEMTALQSQINPHFLYNTLNTIKWMANMQGARNIEQALNSLSALLVFAARSNGDFIPVADEVRFIQDYLKLLKLRYFKKFSVIYAIDDAVYSYRTLKFLLQPLIENAVFHGFEDEERKGILRISARLKGDALEFTVEDDGKGIPAEELEKMLSGEEKSGGNHFNSIGIPNVRKRIQLHFGDNYGVSVHSEVGHGTCVRLTIPAILLEEGEGGEGLEDSHRG